MASCAELSARAGLSRLASCLSLGIAPSVTSIVSGSPFREIASSATFLGPSAAMRRASSLGSATLSPLTAVITSPTLTPAFSAGELRRLLRDQRAGGILDPEAIGEVRRHRLDFDPEPAARDRAVVLQLLDDGLDDSLAIAKPIPTLPPEGEKIAVLTPTTSPSALKVGPPELPWLTGASICRKSS